MIPKSIQRQFLALYLGQDLTYAKFSKEANETIETCFVKLKHISQLSKEDAIEIAMILTCWPETTEKLTDISVRGRIDGDHVWDEVVLNFVGHGGAKWDIRYRDRDFMGWKDSNMRLTVLSNHTHVTDYLRSKGYALPYLGYTVSGLWTNGLIQFENNYYDFKTNS